MHCQATLLPEAVDIVLDPAPGTGRRAETTRRQAAGQSGRGVAALGRFRLPQAPAPRVLGRRPAGFDEYLPPSYTATGAQSPLLIYFHGYGETGDGTPEAISRLVAAGIPSTSTSAAGRPIDHSCACPAARRGSTWLRLLVVRRRQFGGSCNMQVQHDNGNVQPAFCTTPNEVRDFIDYATTHYNVDPSRVYITGLSCGAFGVWEYLGFHGGDHKVAAAVPIAGEGRPAFATASCSLGDTPSSGRSPAISRTRSTRKAASCR